MKKEQLNEMLELQDKLNALTCGENWKSGICEKSGKPIDWFFAILGESAELLESFHWKWWKSVKENGSLTVAIENGVLSAADWQNARMEVIDLWHFALSSVLKSKNNNLSKNAIEVINARTAAGFYEETPRFDAALKAVTAHSAQDNAAFLLLAMYELTLSMEMTFDDVYRIYLQKNALNIFRQENGYQEGSYIKVWTEDGKEDNDVMVEALEKVSINELNYEKVTTILKENYPKK